MKTENTAPAPKFKVGDKVKIAQYPKAAPCRVGEVVIRQVLSTDH